MACRMGVKWREMTGGTVLLVLLLVQGGMGLTFQTDYMTERCNKHLSSRVSGRFETSTSLTYDNLMDCYTTISVASDRKMLLLYNRFEIEDPLLGNCVDEFNAHDGASTSSSTINSSPLCGSLTNIVNMTTSTNHVTFHFVSDNNAVFRGFDIVYTAYKDPPCDVGEFECSNAMCIHSDLRCDDIEQCGDGSDEVGCTDVVKEDEDTGLPIGIIVGCSMAGLLLIIILVIVAYKVYQHYKWKKFVALNTEDMLNDDALYSYPKTDKYTVLSVGPRGRRDPDVLPYFDNPALEEERATKRRGKSRGKGQKGAEPEREEAEPKGQEQEVEGLKEKLERYLDEN